MGAHADADHGNLGDIGIDPHAFGVDFRQRLLDDGEGPLMIGHGHGESQIRSAVLTGILYYHVDDDMRRRDRAEYLRRQARLIGHPDQGNLRFILVAGHSGDQYIAHAVILLDQPGAFDIGKRRTDMHRHAVFFRKLDRADLQNLRAGAGELDHLIIGNLAQLARLRTDARIGGKDAFDIGVNLTSLGVEKRRQRHRAGVRAAPPQGRDVVIFIDPLETGDDDDFAGAQGLDDLGRVDAQDARLAVGVIGLDAHLMAQIGTGRLAGLFDRQTQQRDGHLLAGGDQDIFFPLIGNRRNLLGQGDQPVGLPGHGGNHHDDIVAGAFRRRDFCRHDFDLVDGSDGRAAIFLY